MPPPLALLLCTSFVYLLLRYDRKQAPEVSHASWLPTLWLFAISTKPVGVWFASDSGDESSSQLDQIFLLGLIVAGCVVISWRQFDWRSALSAQPWLLVLMGYMLVSVVWSDIPFIALKRWVRQAVGLVMILVVLSEAAPRQTVECILRRMAYVLIPFSLLLIKYYPHYGVTYGRWSGEVMWVGVADHKTGLGRICIAAALYLSWTMFRKWRERHAEPLTREVWAELLLLLLIWLLLLDPEGKRSATAIAALGAGAAAYLGLRWLGRTGVIPAQGLLVFTVLVLVAFGIGMPLSGGSIAGGINEAMGRNSTFTGRADTWAELVPIAMTHPIFGCGFESYWTPATRELHAMSHAHCAYLEILNELGVVGLGFFTLFVLSVVRYAHAGLRLDHDWASFCLAYLAMVLLHGATESSINSFTGLLGGIILCISGVCAQPQEATGDLKPPAKYAS